MSAIAKPTLCGQGFDILEMALDAFRGIPEFQTPDAGSIDDRATLRPREQLAMRRRVTAATVVRPHFLCRLRRPSQQFVGQRRLAYARRTNEDDSPVAVEISLEITRAIATTRADGVNWHARSNGSDLTGRPDDIMWEA